MAESKKKSGDPTVTTESVTSGDVEGTHPARPPSEVYDSPDRFVYEDNPDKPDPSSVAQIVVDPNEE